MLESTDSSEQDVESLIKLDDDEEFDNKLNEMRKRVEDQLGLGGFNEDEIKYDVLLEKIRTLISEKPEEVAGLFHTLVHDELGIEETKKGG